MALASDIAADVIGLEMKGLEALRVALADKTTPLARAFADADALCADVEGRIVTTGMGKSGHIARKIAATFASTGTPASFVHPAEASHGDLGMVGRNDVILALSLSGETSELGDLVAYSGRFEIPLIAVTAGVESTLARAASVCLTLPAADEACAVTPAPTTSTAMMLALGDALAVSVLRRKGFTASEFQTFHPGGMLGAALKRAVDLMHHTNMPLCSTGDTLEKAVEIINQGGFGCVGVVDETERLCGMLTDGDLRRHFDSAQANSTVRDIMTRAPAVVTEDALAGDVLALFSTRKITAVFIVNEAQHPVGLVHVHDCLMTGVI
ncbi:MAG: KpsF/GutQ family sugar-phosphate isomerase [Pseudomonadota bacterium]